MGPLKGLKVVELAGIGPGPFCAMLLSDMGAEVIRIDRREPSGLGVQRPHRLDLLNRGRRSIAVDLKHPKGVDTVLRLAASADALIEPFRPKVAERLGVGPEECWKRNPRLVYGRMTGWGQTGPLAEVAGHDLNYIALSGALHAIGPKDGRPVPPLNLVGDYGGGALYLAFGIMAAVWEAQRSGKGQVVDVAMVEGAASLATGFWGMMAAGMWTETRESNILDGAAPFYGTYETKDGKYVSLGSIEAKFYTLMLEKLGLAGETLPKQMDKSSWSALRARVASIIKTKTRDEWCQIMEGTDVCFAPVLSFSEAPNHPHNKARGSFVEIDGIVQPAPAPKFSRTKSAVQRGPAEPGEHTEEALRDWGFSADEIAALSKAGAIGWHQARAGAAD
ncbi:MAG: CaiB/BaiF CoA-transferase family protein [Alphaproteobacteria bacterium]